MEKIYMEENKSQQSSKGLTFSVILSFVVALFAVFSIGSYGILSLQGGSKISYAAPVTGNTLTFYKGTAQGGEQLYADGYTSSNTIGFRVPLYYSAANNTNPIFCVEHNNTNVETGTTYNKGDAISDYGLLYLLNNSFVNDKNVVTDVNTNKYVEGWITQVAIWMYLYETDSTSNNSSSKNYISEDEINGIKAVTQIKVNYNALTTYDVNFGTSVYTKYVKPLVDAAKNASNLKKLTVTKAGDSMSKTSDGNFYQSEEISVVGNPSSDLQSYDISVTGIDGIVVIDGDGKELSSLTGVAPGTSFYIRIPADKVTTTVQKINISVTGKFSTLAGNLYNATNGTHQKIVSVTGDTTSVSAGTEIEVVGAPDTGMNTAQTIYFIGLIVLLCGVGIVYANAKPVEIKQ